VDGNSGDFPYYAITLHHKILLYFYRGLFICQNIKMSPHISVEYFWILQA